MTKKITAVLTGLLTTLTLVPAHTLAVSSVPSSNTSVASQKSFEEMINEMVIPEVKGEKLEGASAEEVMTKINETMNSQENFSFNLKVDMVSENFKDTIMGEGIIAPVKREAMITSLGSGKSATNLQPNYFRDGKVYINNPSTGKWNYRDADVTVTLGEVFKMDKSLLSRMDLYKTDEGYFLKSKATGEKSPVNSADTSSKASNSSPAVSPEKPLQVTETVYTFDGEFRLKNIYSKNDVNIKKGSKNSRTVTYTVTEFKEYGSSPAIEFPKELEGAGKIPDAVNPSSANTSKPSSNASSNSSSTR